LDTGEAQGIGSRWHKPDLLVLMLLCNIQSVNFSSPQGKKACEEDESDSDDEAEPVSPTVNLFDKVIATLSSFLQEPALKDTVVEGFAKLLLADTFFSKEVLH